MTEVAPVAMMDICNSVRKNGSVGRPTCHVDVKIIDDVVILGADDKIWGTIVKAVVVLNSDHNLLVVEDIRAFCEGRLAHYKIPKIIEVVTNIPRNAMGKVLKYSLC
ncbi:AMP-binding enzyme [Sporomusa malonica]|uniref:AMP-binding enzyme C-terminal domain-containing protein n=2 Tax=Sporomusa malonica TaxID=112901 RepID=A0A1W2F678_9FIRM|nr:hypothetical protein [Sporomusa malonica]SMD17450.1 AMP-binding enzyme C-terminal domain-containing protein [Sporomusa malonica]